LPFTTSKVLTTGKLPTIAGFALIPALGIACFRLSAWTLYSSELGIPDSNLSFISRILQILTLISFLIIDRRISYDGRMLLRFTLIGVIGMATGAMIYLISQAQVGWYVGVGINGASSSMLMLGWGYYLCSVNSRKSAFGLTLAFAAYGIITWLLTICPSPVIIVLTVAFPFLSVLCLKASISKTEISRISDSRLKKETIKQIPWGLFSIILICTLISILARLLAPTNEILITSPYHLFWPIIFILIFVLYVMWMIVFKRTDQDQLWPVFVLIIFSGLLFYSSFSITQPGFAVAFLRATQECLMLFCWVVTASVVHRHSLPRIFSFALATILLVTPTTLFSSMFSLIFPAVGRGGGETLAIIIAASMSLLLVTATVILIIVDSQSKARRQQSAENSHEMSSPLAQAVNLIAIEFNLTKRESEITLYMSRGYTLEKIANTLFISHDTVRTHAKNLYKKTGVHKKQQLITLLESKNEEFSHHIRDDGV
jgi:DNA-binding CsgD family transcriptional regulator